QRRGAFDHLRDLGRGIFFFLAPQRKRPCADEGLGMGDSLGRNRSFRKNLLGLLEVTDGADLGETGLNYDEAGNDRSHIARDLQRTAVAKYFCVELKAPRGL